MSQTSHNSVSHREPDICYCGGYARLKTSTTPKNPNRRFYGCKVSKDNGGCDYFRWFDGPVSDQTSVASGLLRRATEAEVDADHQSSRVISRLVRSFTLAGETDLLKKKLKESEEENGILKQKLKQVETERDCLKEKFKEVVQQRARDEAKLRRLVLALALLCTFWKLLV